MSGAAVIVCVILFHYIGNIKSNGIASQSSVYYWKDRDQNITSRFIHYWGTYTYLFKWIMCYNRISNSRLFCMVDVYVSCWYCIYHESQNILRYNSNSYFSFVYFKLIFIIHSINQCETENILDIQFSWFLTCMFKCWTSAISPMHRTAWFN